MCWALFLPPGPSLGQTVSGVLSAQGSSNAWSGQRGPSRAADVTAGGQLGRAQAFPPQVLGCPPSSPGQSSGSHVSTSPPQLSAHGYRPYKD